MNRYYVNFLEFLFSRTKPVNVLSMPGLVLPPSLDAETEIQPSTGFSRMFGSDGTFAWLFVL